MTTQNKCTTDIRLGMAQCNMAADIALSAAADIGNEHGDNADSRRTDRATVNGNNHNRDN